MNRIYLITMHALHGLVDIEKILKLRKGTHFQEIKFNFHIMISSKYDSKQTINAYALYQ